MNSYLKKSLTLIELLIAIVLLSVIILAISNIDLFTRFHTISADRRVKLQNEVSYVLDHMTKEISKAIGNEVVYGNNTVARTDATGVDAIRVFIDFTADGQRNTANDRWIAYRFMGTGGADAYQLRYCPQCTDAAACTTCNPIWGNTDILSRLITEFARTKPGSPLNNNWVEIGVTACWDPDGAPYACGTPDNPTVIMRTRIKMPSVSTN